jgi:NADPH-dependent 2,4-dienoyl-CoA reductase/sulfur reductase-like enzyme
VSQRVAIIGNGIAGITAARHVRKRSDASITVISAETRHFYSRTALMYVYMGHMSFEDTKPYEDRFWRDNRIDLVQARVERVDVGSRRLRLAGGDDLSWDALLVASGSRSNRFGWPGQDLPGVHTLYGIHDLRRIEAATRDVDRGVIVGGGLIGVELAEMLASRGIPVTFLVRESSWMEFALPLEESAMIHRQILEHGIDLRLATELGSVEAGDDGRVRAVVTAEGEEIPCGFVGLTVGVSPNVGFLEGSGIERDRGVLVDERLRTSAEGVWAAGDCAQLRRPPAGRRAIEPVWYTGRAMGEAAARAICGESAVYDPGVWFNSAKFFDLEWQVYGDVPPRPRTGQRTLYWEHPSGERAIRIQYREGDEAVLGFKVMGIRYRHEVCEAWIREGRPLRWVLERLGAANFDPELFEQHEAELIEQYNRTIGGDRPVCLRARRGLRVSRAS